MAKLKYSKEQYVKAFKKITPLIEEEFIETNYGHVSTVKYRDGSFKKANIGDLLMNFAYCYVGARGQLIFGFSPEGSQSWEYAEVSDASVSTVFPGFFRSVVNALVAHDKKNNKTPRDWHLAENFVDLAALIIEQMQEEEFETKKAEAERVNDVYAKISNFGRF